MATTVDSSPVQHAICFADPSRSGRSHLGWDEDHFGLWSCKFSADGNEVIAGGQCFIFGTVILDIDNLSKHLIFELFSI